MKKKVTVGMLIGLLVLTAVAAFTLSYVILWNNFTNRITNLNAREAAFYKLSEISAYVQEFFVGEADDDALTDGAADGYVNALSDPGSYYYTADQAKRNSKSEKLNYTGIGIISCFDEKLSGIRILGMYVGSTAAENGLQCLDVITRVEGQSVTYLGYENALERIRGEEGTNVELTVYRETEGSYFELEVRRGAVVSDREISYKMMSGKVGYIKLDNFDIGTDEKFAEAYETLTAKEMTSLVIDLRMNPGGYLGVMSSIADMLLDDGIIYSEKRMDGENNTVSAEEGSEDIRTVLVVDEYTMNAAEYFAAALQENGRAEVVGSVTGGSGYAQSKIDFADGSELVLSTTEYFTPDGNSLQGVGLKPDNLVDMNTAEKITAMDGGIDIQLKAALNKLNK